ncbi:MAG: HEAT repeat domain-containing protein [Anaerolineae bacterium]|nr:HEAT repeat domain-containing protein [Anaerolineae bacterium]
MFDQYVALVQSADPAKRREAIIGFGKLGDSRALKYLAQVYKTDADPALRDLAAKAGRHIQKVQQGGQAAAQPVAPSAPPSIAAPTTPAGPPPSNIPDILAAYTRPGAMPVRGAGEVTATPPFTPDDDDPLAGIGEDEPPPGNLPSILASYTTPGGGAVAGAGAVGATSAAPPESASPATGAKKSEPAHAANGADKVDKAVSPQNKERAARDLRTAYAYKTRNDDANAVVFLAKAFRLNPELRTESAAVNLAVALVGGTGKEAVNTILQKSSEPEAAKPKAKSYDPELIDMLIAVVILFVIIALFNVATVYGTVIIMQTLLPMLFQGLSADITPADMQMLFEGMSLQALLPDILKGSFVTAFATFFNVMIVYITGNLMGGAGSFLRFARVMINYQIAFYTLIALSLGLMVVGLASNSPSAFETLLMIGGLGLMLTLFGGTIVQGWLAGRVHEFSFWKGLASVIVGLILAGIIAGALGMFNGPTTAPDFDIPDFEVPMPDFGPDIEWPTPGAEFGM